MKLFFIWLSCGRLWLCLAVFRLTGSPGRPLVACLQVGALGLDRAQPAQTSGCMTIWPSDCRELTHSRQTHLGTSVSCDLLAERSLEEPVPNKATWKLAGCQSRHATAAAAAAAASARCTPCKRQQRLHWRGSDRAGRRVRSWQRDLCIQCILKCELALGLSRNLQPGLEVQTPDEAVVPAYTS